MAIKSITPQYTIHTKPLCVLNSLDNEDGNIIEQELLDTFSQYYDITIVRHDGTQFERHGIEEAIRECIDYNEPILYIHTKGAGNKIPNTSGVIFSQHVTYPKGASPKDWQIAVRELWKKELTKNKDVYFQAVNCNEPCVSCIYTGPHGETWTNAFVMNPLAAQAISPLPGMLGRLDYQKLFKKIKRIGIRLNDVWSSENINKMQSDIWSFSPLYKK